MLKITRLPEDMQDFFAIAADGLTVFQKAHLVVYIVGLLLGAGRGNLAALSRLRTDGRHRTTLSHFLVHSPWDGLSVVQRVTLWQIEQLREQPGDPSDPDRDTLFPTVDDTKQETPGKKMAGRHRLFDSSNKRYINGTDVVEVVIRFRGKVFPWASQIVLTEDQAKEASRPHKTCVEIGAELLATFNAPQGLKVRVLVPAPPCTPRSACARANGADAPAIATPSTIEKSHRGIDITSFPGRNSDPDYPQRTRRCTQGVRQRDPGGRHRATASICDSGEQFLARPRPQVPLTYQA